MKNIYGIVLATTVCLFSGCEGIFEDLAINPNQNDVNGFYSTPENINKGVIGIYGYIQTPRTMGANIMGLMYNRGDEGSCRGDYVSPGQYTVNLTPSYYTIVEPFSLFFTSISQACQMIETIPGVAFNNEEQKKAYLGEAYFLRAYSHFMLLVNYRNIPMMKKAPKSAREYRPLAKPEEVWDLIISDLKEAKTLLPKKGYWKTVNIGRVTSGSAAAMLGKAYLYRTGIEKKYSGSAKTYYTEAAAAFDEVIKGDHGTYSLPDYKFNFDVAHENNDESLFEIQFRADVVNTGFNPGLSNSGLFISPNGLMPPYNDRYANNQDQVTHDWVYDTFVASKDADGKTDSRMFVTLVFDDTKPEIVPKDGDKVIIQDGKTFVETYGTTGFASINETAGKYKAAGRKWLDWTLPSKNPGGANNNLYFFFVRAQGTNYRYLRYADVLLMYAEAVLMGGTQGSITPLAAVNKVRFRADMPDLPSVTMAEVKTERILEFTGEGHRYYDLLRWGEVVTRFKTLQDTDPNFKGYNTSTFLGFKENKNEWLPLPIDEVNGNPYITGNNQGW